jgi:hypothetical protein
VLQQWWHLSDELSQDPPRKVAVLERGIRADRFALD